MTNVLLPGLGLIVWGPFAAALARAGAGGATGGIIGALVGSAGVPEEMAQSYQSGLGQGGIVLGFRPRTSAEAAEVTNVWKNYNGESIYSLTN